MPGNQIRRGQRGKHIDKPEKLRFDLLVAHAPVHHLLLGPAGEGNAIQSARARKDLPPNLVGASLDLGRRIFHGFI
jgi:hypothetical protein